jgi:hypothetical protein
MHSAKCFHQKCDQSEQKCGRAKFEEIFRTLSAKLGHFPVQLLQHVKLTYTKPDGTKVF